MNGNTLNGNTLNANNLKALSYHLTNLASKAETAESNGNQREAEKFCKRAEQHLKAHCKRKDDNRRCQPCCRFLLHYPF